MPKSIAILAAATPPATVHVPASPGAAATISSESPTGLVNSSAKYPAPAIEKRIRFHRACRERNWRGVRYTFTLSTGDPEITTFFPAFRNISPRT